MFSFENDPDIETVSMASEFLLHDCGRCYISERSRPLEVHKHNLTGG
jgi:hypothetical protein